MTLTQEQSDKIATILLEHLADQYGIEIEVINPNDKKIINKKRDLNSREKQKSGKINFLHHKSMIAKQPTVIYTISLLRKWNHEEKRLQSGHIKSHKLMFYQHLKIFQSVI